MWLVWMVWIWLDFGCGFVDKMPKSRSSSCVRVRACVTCGYIHKTDRQRASDRSSERAITFCYRRLNSC